MQNKKKQTKKQSKVRDLKPKKDAKGGFRPFNLSTVKSQVGSKLGT